MDAGVRAGGGGECDTLTRHLRFVLAPADAWELWHPSIQYLAALLTGGG
jgi:hypothetical protein